MPPDAPLLPPHNPTPAEPADPIERLSEVLERLEAALALGGAPEGLRAAEAARLIGVSESRFHVMNRGGLVPEAVQLGDPAGKARLPVWRRSELVSWLREGAPPRHRWVLIRDQAMRRAG